MVAGCSAALPATLQQRTRVIFAKQLRIVFGERVHHLAVQVIDHTGTLRGELVAKLSALTKKMKRDDLLKKLEEVQVPAGPINNLDQVFKDQQVVHRGMKLELKSADAKDGVIPGVRTPIVIDGKPMASPNTAPKLGQHTQEVLKEIGEAQLAPVIANEAKQ